MNNIQFKGARWFKCDLHLHTPASKCFTDKTVTAEQWVQAALDAGLNCVAVTDHNSGAMIDQIKTAASGKNITVFPGVEITCDTSKIHLLVLFDVDKTTQNVEDFLIECGINRESFAQSDAHSAKTVTEIAEFADSKGALVIPAHIDEYNGLAYLASKDSFNKFISLPFINGVQFVHKEFLDKKFKITPDFLTTINAYYNDKDKICIGEDDIRQAYNNFKEATNKGLKFLTFSDNPESEKSAKHGTFGIGRHYSWIKMDANPTLESLRQALIMPERTFNCFQQPRIPYETPSLWIKRISVKNSTLTKDDEPFEVFFNPQLNTIIGGRGSGKSSILRFLRGVFNNYSDIVGLQEIKQDQEDFFKKTDNKKGVLKDDTIIEVDFIRDGIEYRITYNHSSRNTIIETFDYESKSFKVIDSEGFIDFFKMEQYSQKQIYSIAQSTNSLRNRIDEAIPEVQKLKLEINQLCADYKSAMSEKRSVEQAIKAKGKIITEINDLTNKIALLKQSGISEIISNRQRFVEQKACVQKNIELLNSTLTSLENALLTVKQVPLLNFDIVDNEYKAEILNIFEKPQALVQTIHTSLQEKIHELSSVISATNSSLEQTKLYSDVKVNENSFVQKKDELEKQGISDMTEFEKFTQQITEKKAELANIEQKESGLDEINNRISRIFASITSKRKDLTIKRREFIKGITTQKVKASVKPFGDLSDFADKFRNIIQKDNSYADDINSIIRTVFPDGAFNQSGLDKIKNGLHKIYDLENVDEFGGKFKNVIRNLNCEQINDIDLLMPEDEIVIQYFNKTKWTPLTIASAGQKTTAILTFILSFGDSPLILDQPEDDLDNKLVYDLIVDKMREIKKKRQVIVVTHNANIPVNGDAEYVISLSASSKTLAIQAEGTIEDENVKTEICDVMEGGKEAFDTRAKRYYV